MRRWTATWTVVAAVSCAAACGRGVYHEVRPGETLYRISKAYGVSVEELASANRVADPARIEVGQRLRIPGARRAVPVNLVTPRHVAVRTGWGTVRPRPTGQELIWPVIGGTVTSGFGERGRSFHDGVDITAPTGTPVLAAQDGEVVYSDFLRGYGNVIIVRHTEGLATVYAHNHANRVREGQRVRRGDVIASVGRSGRTTGANLHFEVRQDNVAHDPLYFLPSIEQVAAPGSRAGRGG